MPALLEVFAVPGVKPLWLDYSAYAGRLLGSGAPPWTDVSGYVAWQRKAQGLLKSDVVAVPLEPLVAAWLASRPDLCIAMAAKKRATFAIKTLLAEASLRAHLVELLAALRGSLPRTPLALKLPSPRRWVKLAYAQAQGSTEGAEIGGDEIDSAAVFIADFLRAFGECGLAGLLLDEAADDEPAVAELEWYQPVVNVAAHYRWDLGLRLPSAGADPGAAAGFAFVIAPRKLASMSFRSGLAVPAGFWSGGAAPEVPPGGFRYAEIPAGANPEQVLERLAALR